MAWDIENSAFHELLVFLVLEARISPFYSTRILEANQEKIRDHPEKYGNQSFRNVRNMSGPTF